MGPNSKESAFQTDGAHDTFIKVLTDSTLIQNVRQARSSRWTSAFYRTYNLKLMYTVCKGMEEMCMYSHRRTPVIPVLGYRRPKKTINKIKK